MRPLPILLLLSFALLLAAGSTPVHAAGSALPSSSGVSVAWQSGDAADKPVFHSGPAVGTSGLSLCVRNQLGGAITNVTLVVVPEDAPLNVSLQNHAEDPAGMKYSHWNGSAAEGRPIEAGGFSCSLYRAEPSLEFHGSYTLLALVLFEDATGARFVAESRLTGEIPAVEVSGLAATWNDLTTTPAGVGGLCFLVGGILGIFGARGIYRK